MLALIAPRPLNIGNALWDVNRTFSVSEMLKTYHQVEEVYWNLGVPGNLRYTVSNRVHGMMDEQREALLGWFALHLKGQGNGNPVREPVNELESDLRKLCVFPDPAARPPEVRPTDVHCRIVGSELRRKMLAVPEFSAAKKRRELARVLRMRPIPASGRVHRYAEQSGIRRLALEVGDHLIPILMRPGRVPGRYLALIEPDGKAAVTDAMLDEAGRDGATVVMFDPYGAGETARSNHCLGLYHQTFRQLLWLGRSMPGEWVYDIISVVRMLRRDFHAAEVTVRAAKEAGVCALFAAALGKERFALEAVDAPGSYLFRSDSIKTYELDPFRDRTVKGCLYTPMLSLPGFLKWGDVSLAAALCDAPVRFISPRAYDGTPYRAEEEAAFRAECAALRRKLR